MRHLLGQNIAAAKRTAAVAAGKLIIAEKTVARRNEMRVLNPFLVKPCVDIQFHIVKYFFQHRQDNLILISPDIFRFFRQIDPQDDPRPGKHDQNSKGKACK